MSLRARGYEAEADLLDRLVFRERVCDSQCGAMQAVADAWYRAEKEFDLSEDDPYEAIRQLRAVIMSVQRSAFDAGFDAGQDGGIRAWAYEAWSGQQ
jgi:hypothetical protein